MKTAADSIDALMGAYQGVVPGASVAVLHDGAPILRCAYGFADLENQVAATPDTNYRLASMTKQFTAAAILLLTESGPLSLDDPVGKWLPSLPEATVAVTLRHLLTHRSGIIDYEDVIPDGTSFQLHDAEVLMLLESEHRTYFAPGTGYRYSNSGYALLAMVVGQESRMEFAAFLRERLFKPLHMQNTIAYQAGSSTVVHRAYGYSAAGDGWTRTDQSLTSAVLGDGGIYSSIDDLAKWDAALYDNRLLRAESLLAAFAPATKTDDPPIEYGLGWRITGATVWHSGETMGFRNVIVRYPKHRFAVIVLTNRSTPEPYPTALAIAKLYLPTAIDAPNLSSALLRPPI